MSHTLSPKVDNSIHDVESFRYKISECLDIVEWQAGIVQFPTGIGISKTDNVDIECTLYIKNMKESVS